MLVEASPLTFLNTWFAIEVQLISIVWLIITLCETGPWCIGQCCSQEQAIRDQDQDHTPRDQDQDQDQKSETKTSNFRDQDQDQDQRLLKGSPSLLQT